MKTTDHVLNLSIKLNRPTHDPDMLAHVTDVNDNLIKHQISGYLQYLDAEFIALRPICNMLGWDFFDAITNLRKNKKDTPDHHLFVCGDWIFQSTWGVYWSHLVMWLCNELPNLDHYDKTYASLFALQIMANAGYGPANSSYHKPLIKTALRSAKFTSIYADVYDYLAEIFPTAFAETETELNAEKCYADAT